MYGLLEIIGGPHALRTSGSGADAGRENTMSRKGNGFAAVEAPVQDLELREQLLYTGSSDWSPEQAEQYIDWRIQVVDAQIAQLRQQLDDLVAMRKRWLAVTGGRSKPFGNGHANGNGGGGSNGSA